MSERVSDGRLKPQIGISTVWYSALVMATVRMGSLNGLRLTEESGFWTRLLGTGLPSDDTIGRVLSLANCDGLRDHLHDVYSRMKRNKALKPAYGNLFALIVDGHESSASFLRRCPGCLERRIRTACGERVQYYHRNVTAMLMCKDFPLLLDVEEQRRGETEVAAAMRLLERLLKKYPRAFDLILADGLYAHTEFFKLAVRNGKEVIAVLKDNRRDLLQDAVGLFARIQPAWENDRQKCWDEENFSSWPQFGSVRVVRSAETATVRRQLNRELETRISDWVWVGTPSKEKLATHAFVDVGHGRWDIENKELNELVTYWHADHVYKHHPNAILAFWLIIMLAYNLFHAFVSLNIKPEVRSKYTTLHLSRLIAAELYHPLRL